MRRLMLSLLIVLGLLLAATPAEARWGCGWGYRGCGWGGYRGGWGGYYGWGGYRGCGFGWGGYGGWGNYYGFGGPCYYYPAYNYPIYSFGGYGGYGGGLNYGTPISVGYYSYRPAGGYYNANANFAANSLPAINWPIGSGVNAQLLERFLELRGEVRPVDLALSDRVLPKLSGRVSNVETRQRASRLLAEGDELFRAQNFNSALQRYKLASTLAPDLAEAYWRQGHAFVATRNFDLATTAFKRAIAHTDNLGRGGFRLDDLYGGASIAKSAHLENLAELALAKNGDSDAYFLIGLFLNYDGQADRAEKFFARASDLAGISGGHIAVFLDRPRRPCSRPGQQRRPNRRRPSRGCSSAPEPRSRRGRYFRCVAIC